MTFHFKPYYLYIDLHISLLLSYTVDTNIFKTMFKKVLLLFFFSFFLSQVADATEKKVLVIGLDGILPDAVNKEYTPNLYSLFDNDSGLLAFGYTQDLTFSGPSWSATFNGVHHDRHGVTTNSYTGHDFTDTPHFLKRLKMFDPDIYTASLLTWDQLPNNFKKPDGTPFGVDSLVFHDRHEDNGDVNVTKATVELLRYQDPDAIFYYQNDIDAAGHSYGFSMDIEEYRQQLRVTDQRVGDVLEALNSRTGVTDGTEEWLIVVVSDHGGLGTGHRGNYYVQRFVPMILSGPAVDIEDMNVRPRVVDVARTVLSFMGVPEEEQADLDGRNLLDPVSMPEPVFDTNLVFNGDAEFDRGAKDNSLDHAVSGWRDQQYTGAYDGWHSMTVLQLPEDETHIGPDENKIERKGRNAFIGGSKGSFSKITQHRDLSPLETDIDQRNVKYELDGYLGRKARSSDKMMFMAVFLGENNETIASVMLKEEEINRTDKTVLNYEETDGVVPPGTRKVVFSLYALGDPSQEGVYALADKLSFVLKKRNN